MNPMAPDQACRAIQDDLAALATGTLTGRRRAEVLDHLESCPACVDELEELSGTVDALMALVPEAEPPEGFAERTIALMPTDGRSATGARADREPVVVPMTTPHRRTPRPMTRSIMAVAAVVVALALGVGLGTLVGGSGGPTGGGSEVRTAALQSASGSDGSVVLTAGHPGWLVMTVDDAHVWGTVTCQVTLTDGSRRVVAHYPMSGGDASWAARLPTPASSVRSVQLVGEDGTTLATAQLPSSAQA